MAVNLVVGATGLVGGEICRHLAEAAEPVRALVRPGADPGRRRSALEALGVECVPGDLKDPPSLGRACAGVATVYSTASATVSRRAGDSIEAVDRDGQLALVDAARAAGVGRFAFLSFRAKPHLDSPIQRAKQAAAARLRASGMAWTVLEAAPFMEIWLSPALGFDVANARARIAGTGRNPISWVSAHDVAALMVAAGRSDRGRNAVIPIGGPEALSPLDVVSIFEEETGRKFVLEHVPEEALRAMKESAKDSLEESFAALMLFAAEGDAIDMRETLERYPMRLASVRDYARGFRG